MIQLRINRICSFILSALFAASIFAVPYSANAGGLGDIDVPRTDDVSDRLVGYWDLRERDSFFQVTNVSGGSVTVHIQIYDASNNCLEFDYFDDLTPRDTHVYNVAELDRNNGVALAAPDFTDGHGVIAVSVSPQDDPDNVLTGNFRIVDDAGYEYRTNMAGEGFTDGQDEDDWRINFNGVDGSTFADVIVITYTTSDERVNLHPVVVEPTVYDVNENPISCSPILMGCFEDAIELTFFEGFFQTHINVGINQAVTNSRGGPSLCSGTDTAGFVELNLDDDIDGFDEGAIFIGLNNGSGTGSIDHALAD